MEDIGSSWPAGHHWPMSEESGGTVAAHTELQPARTDPEKWYHFYSCCPLNLEFEDFASILAPGELLLLFNNPAEGHEDE